MNILLVNWLDLENPQAGGAELHLFEIFGRLAARGHRIRLVASGWPACASRARIQDIEINRHGSRNSFALIGRGAIRNPWLFSQLRAAFAGHSEGVLGCAVSPDSLTVVSTSSDGTLRLWSVATQRELALFWQKGRGFDRPMFSKDGRVLAAGSGPGSGGQVQIWRAPSWEEINAIEKARPAAPAREERRPPR